MKTLHYRRHSLRKGIYISDEGLALALIEGQKIAQSGRVINDVDGSREGTIRFDRIFHGPIGRAANTALAFCQGLGYVPIVMPIVEDIGEPGWMEAIGTQAFRAAKTPELTWLDTTIKVHGLVLARSWASRAMDGISQMFESMSDGEVAVAFGHSPIIDLAVWIMNTDTSDGEIKLAEMEGFVFVEIDVDAVIGKVIRLQDKINVEVETTA